MSEEKFDWQGWQTNSGARGALNAEGYTEVTSVMMKEAHLKGFGAEFAYTDETGRVRYRGGTPELVASWVKFREMCEGTALENRRAGAKRARKARAMTLVNNPV